MGLHTKQKNKKGGDGDNENYKAENRLDPRQKLTWDNYINQSKPFTFANATASARAAGYSNDYARNITLQPWFKDKLRRSHLLGKSEKILDKVLEMDTFDEETGLNKADLVRVQVDAAKHITKTLGKDEGYSERTEQVGTGGNVVFLPQELLSKFNLEEKKED